MWKRIPMAVAVGILGLSLSFGTGEAYEVMEVVNGGTISGVVIFDGSAPAPRHFEVTKDPEVCGSERTLNLVEVRHGFLKGTVVVLEGVEAGKPFAARTYRGEVPGEGEFRYASGNDGALQIRSKQCNFGPVAGVLVPEAPVEFVNDDPVKHAVHTYIVLGRDGRIHRTVHQQEVRAHSSMEVTFSPRQLKQSQVVRIGCDRHDFMQNWLYVASSPYFSITDQDGAFTIDGVPPGRYRLVAWHPVLGFRTQDVTVASQEDLEVRFYFSTEKS